MSTRKILIIGGVAGGATAAARARRTDEHAEIIMLEKGPFISFANCGLPYYVGKEIGDRSALLLQTPESFQARFNVDVRVHHEAVAIDRERRVVTVRNVLTGQTYEESYTKLVLAPGAVPIRPALPGIDLANVYTVRTVPDADAIRTYLDQHAVAKAVVIGAGFIGLEMVENLARLGVQVSLVEKADQVLPPLDPEMAAFVAGTLQQTGVEVIVGDGIAAFIGGQEAQTAGQPAPAGTQQATAGTQQATAGTERATAVRLESGREVEGDLFILGIGVRPDTALARAAGLAIGPSGGIVVDDRCRTSDPDIYAAGDAVETIHLVTGKPQLIPLAGPANKQGRVAGANAAGDDLTFPGALGTAIVRVGSLVAACTGLSEKAAIRHGYDVLVSYTVNGDHADYYPGWTEILTKLVVDRATGRLLGAQALGQQGVDKRMDVFATAIAAKMTAADLTNLDLSYAPPFGSAKDPAIVAGMVVQNILRETLPAITPTELARKLESGEPLQIIDVRPSYEYEIGMLPGAINIPIDELRGRLSELDPAAPTVVYCANGSKAYLAVRQMLQQGFRSVATLTGGYTLWPVFEGLRLQLLNPSRQ